MKHFKLLGLFTLLIAILAACATELKQTEGVAEPAQIEFSEGLTLREVGDFIRDNKLKTEYLMFTQEVGGEETVGGMLIEGKDIDNLEATWEEANQGFIEDMASTEEERGQFTTLAASNSSEILAPKITGLTGDFSKAGASQLKIDKRISTLSFGSDFQMASPETLEESEPELDTQARERWAPQNGKVYAKTSRNGVNKPFRYQQDEMDL